MNGFREQMKKDFGIDDKIIKEGIWYNPAGSNLEFLVRPATYHNKELQKKDLELNFKKRFGSDLYSQETPETRSAVAEIYHNTVIAKYRFVGSNEPQDISLEDLQWLFNEYPPVARNLVLFCIAPKNFELIEEQEAKN